MKNRFAPKTKIFTLIWILFHAFIFASFVISLFVSPKINFATSLFDIMPPSSSLREVQNADSALAAKTGRAVTILVKSESFEKAKSAAQAFYSQYADSDSQFFDSLSLYIDSNSISEITDWLHENRLFLIDDETRLLLENGGAQEIADETLASVYGAFTISDLSHLEEDPFLLSERNLKKMLKNGAVSSTAMSLHDDVLASHRDGFWYVLIRGVVSEKGSALASKKNTVKSMYDVAAKIQNDQSIEFIFSGVPFHSYENSTSAQAQISVISTVALVLIVVFFLLIFRSPVPAFVSALAVSFSCATGFVSTLLFFRGIHVLTFVFGTTLIGTCLDYSIHYFVNWKFNSDCDDGFSVKNHIFRGITLGFASTEICFAALFFAPFPLLKQVSVFLFIGLATAYLSVIALYPKLKMPKKRGVMLSISETSQKIKFFVTLRMTMGGTRGMRVNLLPLLLILFSLVVIGTHLSSLKIQNNIQELYSMSPEMLQNEITSAQVLDTGSSGWYFLLKADSQEELLQKNEELGHFLDSVKSEGKLKQYLSVSEFIPSQKKQMQSFNAAKNLLPLAKNQYENLGIQTDDEIFASSLNDSELASHNFVNPNDSNLPATIKEAISNLWIGEIDGAYYSCVLPLHAQKEEEPFFRDYCEQTEGVFFVNKVSDISAQLDILSKSMLKMLGLAFVIVIAILFFCYKPKIVLKIASVPLIVVLATTAVLILCKIPLSFFPITALVLVFGLGLDYIIYEIEGSTSQAHHSEPSRHSERSEESHDASSINHFAIMLSFVTTALSFGALSLSTFPPVHMLGITVFAGLTAAVLRARR